MREREADDDEHKAGDLLEDAPVDDAAEGAGERAERDEDEREAKTKGTLPTSTRRAAPGRPSCRASIDETAER